MDFKYWLILIALAVASGIIGYVAKKSGTRKFLQVSTIVLVLGALVMGFVMPDGGLSFAGGKLSMLAVTGTAVQQAGTSSPGTSTNAQDLAGTCPTVNSATWSVKDIYATTSISGTSYYKAGNNAFSTTAVTAPNKGVDYKYWVSNSSDYYILVADKVADCGTNEVQASAYKNGSLTISGWDIIGDQKITNGVANISMGANANAKIRFTMTGNAKTSNIPLGGLFVVETNNTMTSVICTGDGISSNSGKYHLTYTNSYLKNAYSVFEVAPGYDVSPDGLSPVSRTITCEFQNGGTAVGVGSHLIVGFIPANNYLGNDGNIYLDTEKFANQDSTRAGLGGSSVTNLGWGA